MRSWDLTTYWQRKEASFWRLGWIPKERPLCSERLGVRLGARVIRLWSESAC